MPDYPWLATRHPALQRLHQEAGEAQARSHRERLLLNPLNHPLVKGFSER